jgi:hypothetical protein
MSQKRKAQRLWTAPQVRCFACGDVLTPSAFSVEDVIPRWILRKYSLWDRTYSVNEGRPLRFDKLKIGCCKPCNQAMNRGLETPVREMIFEGRPYNPDTFVLWLAKIRWGLVAMSSTQPKTPSAPSRDGNLETDEVVADQQIERNLIQRFRRFPTVSLQPHHTSFWLYTTQTCADHPQENFDYLHHPTTGFTAIRVGPVGIVAFLFDGRLMWSQASHLHDAFHSQPLNPFQFREIATYGQILSWRLLERSTEHFIMEDHARKQMHLSLRVEAPNLGEPFDQVEYARVLAGAWESWNLPPGEVTAGSTLCSLRGPDGAPLVLDMHESVRKGKGSTTHQEVDPPAE